MEKELIKEAVRDAEKALKEKQKDEIKKMVLKTLEKMERLKKEKFEIEEQIRVLRLDIDDIKEGRLDRIEERQDKDEKARGISVFNLKKKEVGSEKTADESKRKLEFWYAPYEVTWNFSDERNRYLVTSSTGGTGATTITNGTFTMGYANNTNMDGISYGFPAVNCSVAKDEALGAYEIDGKVINLR